MRSDIKIFTCGILSKTQSLKYFIAFIRVFIGCDTISAFYKQGEG